MCYTITVLHNDVQCLITLDKDLNAFNKVLGASFLIVS